jgi:hypothetical protein
MSSSCAFVMTKRPPLLPCLQFKKRFHRKVRNTQATVISITDPRLIDTYDEDVVSWETFQRPSFQRRIQTCRFSLVKQKGTTRKKNRVKSHTYVQIIPCIVFGSRFQASFVLALGPCCFLNKNEAIELLSSQLRKREI